jgi:putative ABC transport system ATP-binding protein
LLPIKASPVAVAVKSEELAVKSEARLAVTATNVTKSFPSGITRVAVLRGVDLSVAQGEFVALTGPSGSGKSTLLHLIAGLDVPTTGTILVDGIDLARRTDDERTLLRRDRIGVVFQSFNLLEVLTAVENVALPLILGGSPASTAAWRAHTALEWVGLAQRRQHRPAELSGGEQQRVAIARALVIEPLLVLADEPTGSLDSENGRQVIDLLHCIAAERRCSILLVTHDPVVATRADRTVRLRDGRVVDDRQGPGGEHGTGNLRAA